ncbi:MAG TPA: hypothetical protein VFV81_10555 [Verrucomicrobiae bacterium]|nr:hypothetical protein [Verrucomicrobiae bacterium]
MSDLEQTIAGWRRQMLAAGVPTPSLTELESHLREDLDRQIRAGVDPETAWELAVGRIGHPRQLGSEFEKVGYHWPHPLAIGAWVLFVVSFLLPSFADGYGWQCAGLSASAITWPDVRQGNWADAHLAALSLANAFMIVSPFLISWCSRNRRRFRVFQAAAIVFVALTWSFILLVAWNGGMTDLKVGAYAWAASFLALFLSLLSLPRVGGETNRKQYV